MMWANRAVYAGFTLLVMALGLGSRKFGGLLPEFVHAHAGDALWASMVYLMFRVLLVDRSRLLALKLSLLLSFGIEFSQLYQSDWINGLRATTLGALVLGKGFLWIDLLRYAVGILLTFAADGYLRTRKQQLD
ncbi:DUF2809 domain-containing protein [Paenibacillus donghaensis]|uniref:DUF2809 domain-containing protein n=1 Tax=Paenibacillus donghaensis TaxID=414771 RepID=A0A2Z2KIT6_9BACL|nr:DUF2809 domain-containing protein [Paenibacillus donghaensis]ASA20812.1 hypothetical protein B9T62_08455 [Paenibacillus donghaensis]